MMEFKVSSNRNDLKGSDLKSFPWGGTLSLEA